MTVRWSPSDSMHRLKRRVARFFSAALGVLAGAWCSSCFRETRAHRESCRRSGPREACPPLPRRCRQSQFCKLIRGSESGTASRDIIGSAPSKVARPLSHHPRQKPPYLTGYHWRTRVGPRSRAGGRHSTLLTADDLAASGTFLPSP